MYLHVVLHRKLQLFMLRLHFCGMPFLKNVAYIIVKKNLIAISRPLVNILVIWKILNVLYIYRYMVVSDSANLYCFIWPDEVKVHLVAGIHKNHSVESIAITEKKKRLQLTRGRSETFRTISLSRRLKAISSVSFCLGFWVSFRFHWVSKHGRTREVQKEKNNYLVMWIIYSRT